jgi:hypothetical protein
MKMYFFNLLKSVSKPSDELEVKDYIHNSKSIVFNSKEEMYLSENEPEYKRNPFDNIGVPMGAAFSPLFATMVLEMVIMKLKKKFPSPILDILIYADDGLFYGCATKYVMDIIREFEKQLKKYGCELKPKGCRMLMENGK